MPCGGRGPRQQPAWLTVALMAPVTTFSLTAPPHFHPSVSIISYSSKTCSEYDCYSLYHCSLSSSSPHHLFPGSPVQPLRCLGCFYSFLVIHFLSSPLSDLLKFKLDHITPLPENLQRLPISIRMKFKWLSLALQVPCQPYLSVFIGDHIPLLHPALAMLISFTVQCGWH